MRISDWSSDVCSSDLTMMAWFYQGGGDALYKELTQEILGLDVYGFYGFPMPAQPFGWFKNPVSTVADVQGFKFRSVGLAADLLSRLGMSVAQLPGGAIVPAMERRVIDPFELDRKSLASGQSGSGRVDLGGARSIKYKKKIEK